MSFQNCDTEENNLTASFFSVSTLSQLRKSPTGLLDMKVLFFSLVKNNLFPKNKAYNMESLKEQGFRDFIERINKLHFIEVNLDNIERMNI